MDDDLQNANPTILNPSDLPSRRRTSTVKQRRDGGTGLFDSLVPSYGYPYNALDVPTFPSDSESDDDLVEDIDEQEIYGMFLLPARLLGSPDLIKF
jgi:hypothetical protein